MAKSILYAGVFWLAVMAACPAHAADTSDQAQAHCQDNLKDLLAGTADPASPVMQYCMGMISYARDHDKAAFVDHMRKSAEAGYAPAQIELGQSYQDGDGVAQDGQEALKWYLAAAEQGVAEAQNDYGFVYFYGKAGVAKDEAKAIPWFRKAADQGDTNSQTLLAEAYYNGHGVTQDYVEARRLYTLAADAGHPFAMFVLGIMYLDGKGGEKDPAKGADWVHKAAERKISNAQTVLASLYATGRGVTADDGAALMWYEIAALSTGKRDPAADRVEARMTPEAVKQAKDEADLRWAQMSSGAS